MSRLDRQSFLGRDSDRILHNATIGFAGLGGGGSHLVQQFAHAGLGGYVLADDDIIEDTNTNRLIGGTLEDVTAGMTKLEIAVRTIRGLVPDARITPVLGTWQDAAEYLKSCDIIIGAVDDYVQREALERFCRRHLIVYLDVGMDVLDLGDGSHLISGQVILSSPGGPCMRCCGFITDDKLTEAAKKYGDAGHRPQVVWSNGVLASTAVGLAIQLLTPWFKTPPSFLFLNYDGNRSTLTQSGYMQHLPANCPHHAANEVGDALFDIRKQPARVPYKSFAPRPDRPKAPWLARAWARLRGGLGWR